MQQPPQQQSQRTWSFGSSSLNSSVGSSTSSLDLVEYAESVGDASSAASTFLLPAPAPPAPATKIQFDVSAALDPSGWFSVASSTASPASVTAVDVTPRPPQQADAFLSLPGPSFEAHHVTPAASSAASSPSPSSSAWSPSPSNPLDSFPTLAVADDELPYMPAPNDAWMDDEFYRNLFSSLGFEMEVGIGVDGSLADGRMPGLSGGLSGPVGGGGLTLRMDDLQRSDAEFAMQV